MFDAERRHKAACRGAVPKGPVAGGGRGTAQNRARERASGLLFWVVTLQRLGMFQVLLDFASMGAV